jgi:hypothetical protein
MGGAGDAAWGVEATCPKAMDAETIAAERAKQTFKFTTTSLMKPVGKLERCGTITRVGQACSRCPFL